MDESLLREIASEYLVPFFSGARLRAGSQASSKWASLVAINDPLSIAFKVHKNDSYRLVLERSQPFVVPTSPIVPEISVVRAFVDVVGNMANELATELKLDLLSTFQRRVVARAMASVEARESALLLGIDQLAKWAGRLYEGSPISASIGFRNLVQTDPITLTDFGQHDFGALLSNGHDTILEFDFEGRFIRHQSLPAGSVPVSFCPLRQSPIAEWTTHDDMRRRVALSLNRLGEILIFRDQQLLFARRSGRWSFLTHEPVITQMGTPHDKSIRRAIYETCLDASFARTGACIGIVSSSHRFEWLKVVAEEDRLLAGNSTKAKTISKIVRGRKFHKLDRRLRQELVAIDGATVLSHDAEVLAVGAILEIPSGSMGGGRLAAANAMAKFGLGIKVSQDGGIFGFRRGRKEPAFRIM